MERQTILAEYKNRIIKIIEEFSAPWKDNGPSKETANAIIKLIKRTPLG